MNTPIPIALTLKKSCQTPEVMAQVLQIAAQLGLEPSGRGVATLSCRVTPSTFADLFGQQANARGARPPAETDYGTPSGYESEDLPIPTELAPYVESITVVPPATRLRRSAG